MHLFKEICILIRLCRHTRSFSVFLAISTGLFYTIEVYPLSSERVNKLPNNPQEEKKTTSAFFLPKNYFTSGILMETSKTNLLTWFLLEIMTW